MMAKYRKKPVVIEAIQLNKDRERIATCIEWVEGIDMSTSVIGGNASSRQVLNEDGFGDYMIRGIIKGVQGEFHPCKPDVFEQIYEIVK